MTIGDLNVICLKYKWVKKQKYPTKIFCDINF